MQRLYPDMAADLDPDAIYDALRDDFPPPPADRPYLFLNMVTSVDGKAALNGGASGIGSALDKRLMKAIRAACDAVLNGAATLRAEKIDPRVGATYARAREARGLPPEPLAILLSRTGDLPLDRRYFTYPGVSRLIVSGEGTPPKQRAALSAHAELLIAPGDQPDLTWVMRTLREAYRVRYLLVEGGPNLNGNLFAAGLVDEICWTLGPKIIGGGESLTLVNGPTFATPVPLTLRSAYLHEDEFFLRYRVRRG
jgi:2,5-diamino-6-(ribosylamino)-4(3H)-pyrimidinone 5'-phosphate reductase